MTLLSPFQLVELDEKSRVSDPVIWSLDYLRAAYPELRQEDVLQFSLGTHGILLMAARAANFGTALSTLNACTKCSETVEINCRSDEIGLSDADFQIKLAVDLNQQVKMGRKKYSVRALSVADLLHAEQQVDASQTHQDLLELVAPDVNVDNQRHLLAVEKALDELDPAADVWLVFRCPTCATNQSIAFDPIHYVMIEVQRYARQVLREVASLALCYHWSEHDIMTMPSSRRNFYLQEAGL